MNPNRSALSDTEEYRYHHPANVVDDRLSSSAASKGEQKISREGFEGLKKYLDSFTVVRHCGKCFEEMFDGLDQIGCLL